MLTALPIILQIMSALSGLAPELEQLVTLVEGIFTENRAPTAAEWAKLEALAASAEAAYKAA